MASDRSAASEAGRASVLSLIGLRDRLFSGAAGGVFRGMATLALGSGAARVISTVSIPVLTRIYSPGDYGVLAIFTALIAMLVPILTLSYMSAVPLPRHDGAAMCLMALSTGLTAAITLAVGLLLWAFAPALLSLISMEALAPWRWLIVLGLIGTGTYEILSMWATRRRAYKKIANTEIFQSGLGATVKIALGLLALKPFGLLIGQVAAQSGGIGSFGRCFWNEFRANMRFVTFRRIRLIAGRYRGFPIYRLPSQFLLVFAMQAPLMFTAKLYGAETTGQLGLAQMALALPMGLLGYSMSKAYYAEIAEIGRRKPDAVRALTYDVIRRLFLLSLAPALILLLFGPQIFALAFGHNWRLAGELASLLSIYLVFQFIQAPVAHILYVFEGQRVLLYLNIQRTLLILISFAAGHYLALDVSKTILIYSTLLSGHYLFSVYRSLKEIPN